MRWKKATLATIIAAIALLVTWASFKEFINLKTHNTSYVSEINKLETSGAPDRSFEYDDKSYQLYDVKSPITMIHFWASWCAPCIDEFPHLVEMSETMKGKVKIYAISLDESLEEYSAFLSSLAIKNTESFVVLRDPNYDYATKLGTEKLPETYILDKDKKLIRKVPTPEKWNSPQVIEFLNYVGTQNI